MDTLALILSIIGCLNWGSIGIFQFDLVSWLFGGFSPKLCKVISFTSNFPPPAVLMTIDSKGLPAGFLQHLQGLLQMAFGQQQPVGAGTPAQTGGRLDHGRRKAAPPQNGVCGLCMGERMKNDQTAHRINTSLRTILCAV